MRETEGRTHRNEPARASLKLRGGERITVVSPAARFYVVPLYHLPEQWVARWTTIAHPAETSLFGYLPETWWRKTPDQRK